MDDDKDKSVIEKLVDTVSNVVGETVRAAVLPTRDTEAEAVAEKTNEQMLVGDAAIAPEAIPALIAPQKTALKKRVAPQRANKRAAKAANARSTKAPAKKSSKKTVKKSAPKKATKKSAKKTAKKSAKKKKKSKK
jgi:hypothetical protein